LYKNDISDVDQSDISLLERTSLSVDTLPPIGAYAANATRDRDDLTFPVRSVAHAVEHALRHAGYEVLPLRNAEQAILASVPAGVPLSVTMTASKGVEGTIELAERLAAHGYSVTPHLAARMFRDTVHLADTAARLTDQAIDSIFVIGGDSPEPAGPFTDALALLEQFATSGHSFRSIGVGGYPEGHAHIADDHVDRALQTKARHATHIVTQMCFRGATTAAWARQIKRSGVDLPIRIGLPGAVTRQKLARISAKIGLGQSARFLVKQNSLLWRFFLPGGYRPDRLINALAPTLGGTDHALAGFHFFTFNEVARTEAWRQTWLTRLQQAIPDT
jgi:methylenetetrahydrofolate reductase (NADPH)